MDCQVCGGGAGGIVLMRTDSLHRIAPNIPLSKRSFPIARYIGRTQVSERSGGTVPVVLGKILTGDAGVRGLIQAAETTALKVERWMTIKGPLHVRVWADRMAERVEGAQGVRELGRLISPRGRGGLDDALAATRRSAVWVVENGADNTARNKHLMAELRLQGATPRRIALADLSMHPNGQLLHKGTPIADPEAIIARPIEDADIAMLRTLEQRGVFMVDPPEALRIANSKGGLARLFVEAGIPHPHSLIVSPREQAFVHPQLVHAQLRDDAYAAAAAMDNQVVVKTFLDSGSRGVERGLNATEARAAIDRMLERGPQPLVIQKYYPEGAGIDRRVLVIRNAETGEHEVFGAMLREAKGGDWRANGGPKGMVYTRLAIDGSDPNLSQEELEIARRAVAASGVDYAGVDIMRTHDGPMVIEINPTPGTPELDIPMPREEHALKRLAAWAINGQR